MSESATYWEKVERLLAEKKAIKPTVDTCPYCWAISGLPAFCYKGTPDSVCGTCVNILQHVKVKTN